VKFKDVRRVFSHPVALDQCLNFFKTNRKIQRNTFYDTAGSVKMIVEQGLKDAAGIASAASAETYGAHILKKSIEDDRKNYTRFFLLRRHARGGKPQGASKQWKTSLVFSTRNVPGALFRALAAFALRDLSLTKIESRPLRGKPWEYLFYVDFLGRVDAPEVHHALGHLGELADYLRVLGCYPKGA
jgi:prephenate dehydratase